MRAVISRSLGRKLAATCLAVLSFVLLYEVGTFDSRDAALSAPVDATLPVAGTRLRFTATAYCKGTTTASGVGVRTGIAASDPGILPVGSVVNVSMRDTKYNGVYTIMDTGPKVQGRELDIYMWSCHEALAFGRRPIDVTVLRLGWNPSASAPSLIDRLFRRREAARRNAPDTGATVPPDGTVRGASDGAPGATVPSEPTVEPSNLAPSDAPSHPAPSHPAPSVPPLAPEVPPVSSAVNEPR